MGISNGIIDRKAHASPLAASTLTAPTKKPAIKAGFFFTCIPRQKTT